MKGKNVNPLDRATQDDADTAMNRPIVKTCKTCPNKVSQPWLRQCDSCIVQNVSIEDHEAAKTILDRVMAGLCQNCGKKESCTCKFIG